MAQTVRRLPTMQETRVQSLGREDLLEKEITHSSILAWKIPWMEEAGRLQSMGLQSRTRLSNFTFSRVTQCISTSALEERHQNGVKPLPYLHVSAPTQEEESFPSFTYGTPGHRWL